ncbi:MAG: 3-dehydroquinate synthase [Gemmatimonadaceae bacterium]|nr:3-dehydroquinate synthase [Gemmatimonadaceae bacterium]
MTAAPLPGQSLTGLPLSYPVYCAPGALNDLAAIVQNAASAHRYAIISDDTVAAHHADRILDALRTIAPAERLTCLTIPAGEQEKTRAQWASLTDRLIAFGAGRDTTVIALGGGVIGDLAGFVAATFMRGLPVVQVPTSLLAMVDASVGGKTAVDTPDGKNLVGAFHDPSAVVMDTEVLSTLPADVLRTGLAEMLKHGVIADAAYFQAVLDVVPLLNDGNRRDVAQALAPLVAGSVRIKAAVVAEDAREGGKRQVLNFGHTIAHAIEKVRNYDMLHGDAVALGMIVEARLAELSGLTTESLTSIVREAVQSAGLPITMPAGVDRDAVLRETHGDKKARGGAARYALPVSLGAMDEAGGRWARPIDDALVLEALGEI